MYIEPNSIIKFYRNMPLDSKYQNTLYFDSVASQNAFFHTIPNSRLITTLTHQSYQRVVKGTMRVGVPAERLYSCNYLAFQNTSFGSKWFYAFVTSVEYINNETCEVTFSIDSIQTYLLDCTIKECFVEREHSESDGIGENIVPENVDLGEYEFSDYQEIPLDGEDNLHDLCVIVQIVDTNGAGVDGIRYDHVYSGCEMWAFLSSDVAGINAKISQYLSAPESIVSIFMCPFVLVGRVATGGTKLPNNFMSGGANGEMPMLTGTEGFGSSWTPKNKKLYTYPYNFAHFNNGQGDTMNMRYEWCNLHPQYRVYGSINAPVQMVLKPFGYKGVAGYLSPESLSLSDYPTCSWNNDTYAQWYSRAIEKNELIYHGLAGMGTGLITGGVGTSLTSGVLSVVDGMLTSYSKSLDADVVRGRTSGSVAIANNTHTFFCARCHINIHNALIIDDYFTKFGYATNRVKVPNISVRPYFNFVKTHDCLVVGEAPATEISSIENAFNSGITFWKNADLVGDYSVDNSAPIT